MNHMSLICTLLTFLIVGSCKDHNKPIDIPDPTPIVTPTDTTSGNPPVNPPDTTGGKEDPSGPGGDDPSVPGGDDPVTPSLDIFSISCGPGADASGSMMISWATDSTEVASYVEYTKSADTKWRYAKKAEPEQKYFCTDFDGIWSKTADGADFYESARFLKYGTTLSGLDSDADYIYRIKGSDGSTSRVGRFRTAGAKKWSCCVISDFHTYTPLPKRLTSAMGMIDKMEQVDPSLDWVLSPGDVNVWGGSYSFWVKFFEEQNCADYMWARVNGNHDNWTREANEVTKDYDIPNYFFKGTSYYPQNGYGDEMGVCYHFRYGNTLFVMLNSEDMSSGSEHDAAAAWTRSVVNAARAGSNPPKFVVVLMHIEWFYGTNGSSQKYKKWKTVFDELGVNLAIAGDNHVYVRTYPLYNDKVITDGSKGTVYLQTPASDNDRGRDIEDGTPDNAEKFAFRWTEGSHSIGAIHMEVDGTTMTLRLMDRNGTVQDSTTITAR